MSYIRVAQVQDSKNEERFVILVAPDELHATITLTGTRVHGPMSELDTRRRLADLNVTDGEIETLFRRARQEARERSSGQ